MFIVVEKIKGRDSANMGVFDTKEKAIVQVKEWIRENQGSRYDDIKYDIEQWVLRDGRYCYAGGIVYI